MRRPAAPHLGARWPQSDPTRRFCVSGANPFGGWLAPTGMPRLDRLTLPLLATLAWSAVSPAAAQEPRALTLDDAVQLARQHDPRLAGARSLVTRREAEVMGARGRLLPRLDFEQALTRGDQPVYAFGTRLLQGRFAAADLALPALNAPSPITDHASRLTLRVPLVHAEGWFGARAAREQRRAAAASVTQAELELAAGVARAYYGAQLASEGARVATVALEAARADAERVRSMLRNEMATELDLMTVELHVASMEQRSIEARGEAEAAAAALQHALGLPLDQATELSSTLPEAEDDGGQVGGMTRVSVDQLPLHEHPEVSRAEATEAAVAAAHRASLARFAPVLAAAAELQSHRSQLVGGQHGESWTVGLVLQVNLFNGLQDLAQRRATEADLDAVRVSTQSAVSAVRLRIRQAQLALEAREAGLTVAARSVELARGAATLERQRMDNGRSDAAALVRSQAALLDTELRLLAARHARELARVDLEVALGGINVNPDEVSP